MQWLLFSGFKLKNENSAWDTSLKYTYHIYIYIYAYVYLVKHCSSL